MTELTTSTLRQRTLQLPKQHPHAFLFMAALVWWVLYQALTPASEALVAALPVDRASRPGGALQFIFYDTPKVLLLLTAVVFVMGMVNSYFTPGPTSWPASPSVQASTAGYQRISWLRSWAKTPRGGR